ncbi:MAG: toll/interleukin-1 receptor domain-containing protein [Gemmatimonadales bacterium]
MASQAPPLHIALWAAAAPARGGLAADFQDVSWPSKTITSMRVIDSIKIESAGRRATIDLCLGDLAAVADSADVDLLVVSAFPNDYQPTPTSLIGALDRKGVSLATLAQHKALDLRAAFGAWLSPELAPVPGLPYRRVLCFEPAYRGQPPAVVGDIFRALAPTLPGPPPILSVAMPLVAAGDQGYRTEEILPPLLDAAVNWLRAGMPLVRLMVVVRNSQQATEAAALFGRFRAKLGVAEPPSASRSQYDIFVSYSHLNADAAQTVAGVLSANGRSVFLDRLELDVGCAWQQRLYEAIENSRFVTAIYSPGYVQSKMCQEEFNIALFRARKTERSLLVPIYWQATELPTYMELVQHLDCREADADSLRSAAGKLASVCAS